MSLIKTQVEDAIEAITCLGEMVDIREASEYICDAEDHLVWKVRMKHVRIRAIHLTRRDFLSLWK